MVSGLVLSSVCFCFSQQSFWAQNSRHFIRNRIHIQGHWSKRKFILSHSSTSMLNISILCFMLFIVSFKPTNHINCCYPYFFVTFLWMRFNDDGWLANCDRRYLLLIVGEMKLTENTCMMHTASVIIFHWQSKFWLAVIKVIAFYD